MSGVSVMENRGKKKQKGRNRAEIVKVKRAAGLYIHLERKSNVSHPVGLVHVCVYTVLWWWQCVLIVAGVSGLLPLCKQDVKKILYLEDLELICKRNVILNVEHLLIKYEQNRQGVAS